MAHSPLRNYFMIFRVRAGDILYESDLSYVDQDGRASLRRIYEGTEGTESLTYPDSTVYYVEAEENPNGTFTIR